MTGKEIRLGKLLSRGKAVIVAADHGSYMGPFPGIDELPRQINALKKADGLLLMPGMVQQCRAFFADRDAPLCLVRVNYATHYVKAYDYKRGFGERLVSVKHAVSIGADMVMVSLLFSGDDEANTRNITQFGEYVEEAQALGIPVIGEYIPLGSIDTFQDNIDRLILGTRAVAEFGCDLIKTVFVERFDEIVKSAGVPVFGLGGAKTDKPVDSFRAAHQAVQKGAAGVVFGRNVICADDPARYLDHLIGIVKQGENPDKAAESYGK
jgi:DhnA family fructose-bisphosphate aldolase class Ia